MRTYLILSQILILAAIVSACATTNTNPQDEKNIPFTLARHYFFDAAAAIPQNPVVTSQEAFDSLYHAAAVMGKDGAPTAIDFSKQFVIGVVLPLTNDHTELTDLQLTRRNDLLTLYYRTAIGRRNLSWTMRPMALMIVDRRYLSPTCVLKRLDQSTH